MDEAVALLEALRHGDSFFPSGSIAFSWGLETLRADGELAGAAALQRFLEGQLEHRWDSFDVPALVAAARALGEPARLAVLDGLVEAMTLAPELREGSRRAGAALLKVHAALGTPGAGRYRDAIARGEARGHLPVMQGMLWTAAGLSEHACRALSAHTFCTGVVGAAMRLGMIGHLDAQRVLSGVRPLLARLLRRPAAPVSGLHACVPHAEIAVMRHEVQDSRVFAN